MSVSGVSSFSSGSLQSRNPDYLSDLERLLRSCGSETMVSVFKIAMETDRLKNSCLKDAGYTDGASLSWKDPYEKKLPGPVHWFADDQSFFFSARIRNLNTGQLFKCYFVYQEGDPYDARRGVEALGDDRLLTVYFDPLDESMFHQLKDLLSGRSVILPTGTYRKIRSNDPYVLDF